MRRAGLLLALALSGCASAPPAADPEALMAEAWAAPFVDYGDWLPRKDGVCRNKVLWVHERCRCGKPIMGWRIMDDGRRVAHMALLLPEQGRVLDFDGAWPVSDYPMLPARYNWRLDAGLKV